MSALVAFIYTHHFAALIFTFWSFGSFFVTFALSLIGYQRTISEQNEKIYREVSRINSPPANVTISYIPNNTFH